MNKNSVELLDYMGGDNLHSLAAWSSTFLEFGVDIPDNIENRVDILVNHILNNGKKKRSVEDLLNYLASNEHTSPFRFSSFVFGMTTDIATHIQKLKHKVILEAENGESARYKELKEDKFYLPEDWKDIKVSASGICFDFNADNWYDVLKNNTVKQNVLYHECLKDLILVLDKKRAKERARYFKTYNSQINTLNKFSFDGVVQFAYKRNTEHAQKEVAFVAQEMINCIKNIPNNPFKYSLEAFKL